MCGDDSESKRGRIEIGPLCPSLGPMFFPYDKSMDEYLKPEHKEIPENKENEGSTQST